MNVREYVDSLFVNYPDSIDLDDFKEEISSNLQERIDYLCKRGASPGDAFNEAAAELGDISEIADQISHNKRKEVIQAMYMKTRNYMSKRQTLGYTIMGGLLALGIVLTLVAYFATDSPLVGVATLIPFFIFPACGFIFLGLTQETARSHAMSWKRALLYAAAAGLALFGLVTMAVVYFSDQRQIHASIATLIPFTLPGGVALGYLLLTEKNRSKPWVAEQQAAWEERMGDQFADPRAATRFGLYSGAVWILAAALFVTLGFVVGFQYSWTVFLFALAAQMIIQARMIPKDKK